MGGLRATFAERIGRAPPLTLLPQPSLERLAEGATSRDVRRGQLLYRQGSIPDVVALVLTGELRLRRGKIAVRTLGPDTLVGLATTAGSPHSADVFAAEDGVVLVIPGALLRAVVAEAPEAALAMVAHLADLLARVTDEALEERTLDLDARILARLGGLAEGRGEVTLTHGEIAAHVGATRANVSRALARLEARGALKRGGRGKIELC